MSKWKDTFFTGPQLWNISGKIFNIAKGKPGKNKKTATRLNLTAVTPMVHSKSIVILQSLSLMPGSLSNNLKVYNVTF